VKALVIGSRLLVADEPGGMLNASIREAILNFLIASGNGHNKSILSIIHLKK
jgi:ABC-type oligopeptide transport system ATPase subunit